MPKIVPGFTTCPHCIITRTPQEPYMAVPCDDGRVFCYACNNVTMPLGGAAEHKRTALTEAVFGLPRGVNRILLALISMPATEDLPTYTLVSAGKKGLGFSEPMTDADHARAAAAVAQGNADVLLSEAERVELVFSHGPHMFHTLRLSYLPDDLKGIFKQEDAEEIGPDEAAFIERLPALEGRAVRQLILSGFTANLDGADISSALRRVPLLKGSNGRGITAEVSWTV